MSFFYPEFCSFYLENILDGSIDFSAKACGSLHSSPYFRHVCILQQKEIPSYFKRQNTENLLSAQQMAELSLQIQVNRILTGCHGSSCKEMPFPSLNVLYAGYKEENTFCQWFGKNCKQVFPYLSVCGSHILYCCFASFLVSCTGFCQSAIRNRCPNYDSASR